MRNFSHLWSRIEAELFFFINIKVHHVSLTNTCDDCVYCYFMKSHVSHSILAAFWKSTSFSYFSLFVWHVDYSFYFTRFLFFFHHHAYILMAGHLNRENIFILSVPSHFNGIFFYIFSSYSELHNYYPRDKWNEAHNACMCMCVSMLCCKMVKWGQVA